MAKKGLSWRSFFACYGKVGDSPSTGAATKRVARHGSLGRRSSFSDVGNCTPPFSPEDLSLSLAGSNIHSFTMAELRAVTQNFSMSQLIGEGGFGPVYKGYVDEKLRPGLKPQTVAVKLLDQEGLQGHKEWLAEVIYLGQLRHPRLVKLIGYCCEDEHRLLVYEFMARGSLENHLFRRYFASLPWKARIEIAVGAAKGLAFLHEAEKQVIYRDFKASNILLDSDYKAKLSDFGLAKDGPQGEDTHVSTRVMGTQGYAAPEYIMTGHLTAKSDVYSFGVVLLELLSGRRSVDKARPSREQNLVEWARPWLNDHRKLNRVMDPNLDGQYSTKGAQKAAALAYQCLSHLPKSRPPMKTIVEALEPLLLMDDIPTSTMVYSVVAAAAATEEDVEADVDVGKAQAKENGHMGESKEKGLRKMEAKETGSNHQQQQHQHHHGTRLRIRPPKPVSYTDTALYRNSPRHNRGRGA